MTTRKRVGPILAATLLLCSPACRQPATDRAGGRCPDEAAPSLEPPKLDLTNPGVSRANLRAWIELLTSPTLEGRHSGESGARAVAGLLGRQLAEFGLVPTSPAAGYCQAFPVLDGEDYNVVARSRPDLGDERPVILLSAHYDGQGKHPAGMVYPGADDNASGIAALLELARLAQNRAGDSRHDWVFAALGAEEAGRLGSRAFLRHPPIDLSRVELAINLDMVGRPLPGATPAAIGLLALGGREDETSALMRRAADASGVEVRDLTGFGDLRPAISDADVLAERLPTVLLSTALHEDHHQLTDVPERVDLAQVERAADLALALALALADILAGR